MRPRTFRWNALAATGGDRVSGLTWAILLFDVMIWTYNIMLLAHLLR